MDTVRYCLKYLKTKQNKQKKTNQIKTKTKTLSVIARAQTASRIKATTWRGKQPNSIQLTSE